MYRIALHDGVGVCVMQYYNEDHILSGAAYKTGSSKNYATTPSYNKSYKYIYTHFGKESGWLLVSHGFVNL